MPGDLPNLPSGYAYALHPGALKGRDKVWLFPDKLDKKHLKQLTSGGQRTTPFTPYDRLFPDFDNGNVFDVDFDAYDIHGMLAKSGRARALEQVFSLPIRGADSRITGKVAEAVTLCKQAMDGRTSKLIGEMTNSFAYRRSFHEIDWEVNASGQAYPAQIGWRPATSCETGFDPATGRLAGFRQNLAFPGGYVLPSQGKMTLPGYAYVQRHRAVVHTNGAYRDPVHGVGDLDVSYFWWQTAQKVLFLLCQFLENQSIPIVAAYGQNKTEAQSNAEQLAELKAGDIAALSRSDPTAKMFDIIESSGQGAAQFLDTIRFCNGEMVASGLAGFTELAADSGAGRGGSYALSQDQSEFFLSSRQAVADEIADTIREQIFRPLVAFNLGADVEVPKLEIGPLASDDLQRALDTLGKVLIAPTLNVPQEFVDQLVLKTASYLGLDPDLLEDALNAQAQQKAEQQKQQAAAAAANPLGIAGTPPVPGAKPVPSVNPQAVAQAAKRKLAVAVNTTHGLVQAAQAGTNPNKALKAVKDQAKA